MEITSCTFEK